MKARVADSSSLIYQLMEAERCLGCWDGILTVYTRERSSISVVHTSVFLGPINSKMGNITQTYILCTLLPFAKEDIVLHTKFK